MFRTTGRAFPSDWPRPPDIFSPHKLDSVLSEREWNQNNSLSRRFSVRASEPIIPPRTSTICYSNSIYSGLEDKSEKIAPVSVSETRISWNHLGYKRRTDMLTAEESHSSAGYLKKVLESKNMVPQVSSSSSRVFEFRSVLHSAWPPTSETSSNSRSPPPSKISQTSFSNSYESPGINTVVACKSHQECSPSSSDSAFVFLDRRIRLGLGRRGSRSLLSGSMVQKTTNLEHQSEGTLCGSCCNLDEPSTVSKPYRSVAIRQQDSDCLHTKSRWPKVGHSPRGNEDITHNGICVGYSPSSVLHSRNVDYDYGQPFSVPENSRLAHKTLPRPSCVSEVGGPNNRSICLSTIKGSRILCVLGSQRPKSDVHRRIFQGLELPVSLGVSSPTTITSNPSAPEPSVRSFHCCGTAVGEGVLASRFKSQSSGTPNGIQESTITLNRSNVRTGPTPDRQYDIGDLDNTGWHKQVSGWSERDKKLLTAAWRPSTRSSYRKPWNRWISWAQLYGIDKFSPSPHQLARFLAFLFHDENLSPSSISLHKSVVCTMTDPDTSSGIASHPVVTKMLKGIVASSTNQYSRSIWDVSKLRSWIVDNPPSITSFYEVSRHLALLLLLTSGRRVHDLTLLRVNSSALQLSQDSVTFWPAFGSKTDPSSFQQSGWHISSSTLNILWDIPHWVGLFIPLRAVRCGNLPLDDLFISSYGKVRPASRCVIPGWVKKALTAAGIPCSAGSMRSAINSALARDNFSLDVIMQRGNWRSADSFLRHYYRPSTTVVPQAQVSNPCSGSFIPIP